MPSSPRKRPPASCPSRVTERVYGHVTAQLKRDLRQLAREEGVSESEVIRAALTQTSPGEVRSACRLALLVQGRKGTARGAILSPSEAKDPIGGYIGKATEVLLDGPGGCLERLPATWRLVERSKVITSHRGDFTAHPKYPKGVQERDYNKDKNEQLKVQRNSSDTCFAPSLIFNTSPGATDGTSICLPDGWCLSGNSRGMVIERVYQAGGEGLERLKTWLAANVDMFGFERVWLDAFKEPSIVRVLEGETRGNVSRLKALVRRFNEPLTMSLSPVREQVAQASKITPEDLRLVQLGDEGSIKFWLNTESSRPFVRKLRDKGVINDASAPRYISKSGLLSRQGVDYAIRVLAGLLVPRADLLDRAGDQVRAALAQSAPFILAADEQAARSERPDWLIRPHLPRALRLRELVKNTPGTRRAEQLRRQLDIEGNQEPASPFVEQLANVLIRKPGVRQQPQGWKKWSRIVTEQLTPALFGSNEDMTPLEALTEAFGIPRHQDR